MGKIQSKPGDVLPSQISMLRGYASRHDQHLNFAVRLQLLSRDDAEAIKQLLMSFHKAAEISPQLINLCFEGLVAMEEKCVQIFQTRLVQNAHKQMIDCLGSELKVYEQKYADNIFAQMSAQTFVENCDEKQFDANMLKVLAKATERWDRQSESTKGGKTFQYPITIDAASFQYLPIMHEIILHLMNIIYDYDAASGRSIPTGVTIDRHLQHQLEHVIWNLVALGDKPMTEDIVRKMNLIMIALAQCLEKVVDYTPYETRGFHLAARQIHCSNDCFVISNYQNIGILTSQGMGGVCFVRPLTTSCYINESTKQMLCMQCKKLIPATDDALALSRQATDWWDMRITPRDMY